MARKRFFRDGLRGGGKKGRRRSPFMHLARQTILDRAGKRTIRRAELTLR
jgi:hypothetical protein